MTFNFGYGSQVARNFSGGTDRLTRSADQWLFQATADVQKLWGWKGAVQATLTDSNGRNLGADAALDAAVAEPGNARRAPPDQARAVDGGGGLCQLFLRVSESHLCGSQPGSLVSSYWVNWPTSQWAARVKYQAPRASYVQRGVYQVNPRYIDDAYARRSGWKPDNPRGTTGALVPVKFGWHPLFDGRAGSYRNAWVAGLKTTIAF